jgi:2-dehydropantoate 2-reductase
MKTLIVGAGAIGGYFGGRLLASGCDVTFLVRPGRARQLAEAGLSIKSRFGDVHIPNPPAVLADDIESTFDVIMVGCKAYDLPETMESFARAVGPNTVIMPLLNGMRHLDILASRFGERHVLGGLCMISVALDDNATIVHFNDTHDLQFGALRDDHPVAMSAIEAEFSGAGFNAVASGDILQAMWEKWIFIASAAGLTTLFRSSIGDIVDADGTAFALALYEECCEIASAHGHRPSDAAIARGRAILTAPGSPLTASMYKDMERGARTEGDHIIGDLLSRSGKKDGRSLLLEAANINLRAYEARRARRN